MTKHPWYHYFFEYVAKVTMLRDGFLGDFTPDVDIEIHKCSFPGCKWEKEERIYPNENKSK